MKADVIYLPNSCMGQQRGDHIQYISKYKGASSPDTTTRSSISY